MTFCYKTPEKFFPGQCLWYKIVEGPTIIVHILDIKETKCEIVFASSDNTTIWVPKNSLREIMERKF